MGTVVRSSSKAEAWTQLVDSLSALIPHATTWWDDEEGFRELRIKVMPDGTTLAIAKGFGTDGGLVVCFGVGYGVAAAMLAIDGTIQGGNWRVDKPYPNGQE